MDTKFLGPAVVLVAAVLTLGVGFCLFDVDHEGGGGSHALHVDLCFGMLVASMILVFLPQLLLSGWAMAYRLARVVTPPLYPPAPPPKRRLHI